MLGTLQKLAQPMREDQPVDELMSELSELLGNLRKWSQDFSYEPLDQKRSEIRLVRIHRNVNDAKSGENITADIFVTSLNSNPHYVALSYVWGDTSETLPIVLNGHFFEVPLNLYCALSWLQQASEDVTIWIDLLCINQTDQTEKNWQVQQMNQIYRNAFKVLIWLGIDNGEGNSRDAFTSIALLSDLFEQTFEPGSEEEYEGQSFVQKQHTAATQAIEHPDIQWDALIQLFCGRQWFRRIWCVQEMIVARQAILWYGIHMLDWSAVQHAILIMCWIARSSAIDLSDNIRDSLSYAAIRTSHLVDLYSKYIDTNGEGVPLWEILQLTRLANVCATDHRDYVYALLGLSSKIDRAGIAIRYEPSSTIETVLFDTAKILLLQHGVKVLEQTPLPEPDSVLPSWVVDWTCPDGFSLDSASSNCLFHASKGLTHDEMKLDSTTYANPVLSLKGVVVGKIEARGNEFRKFQMDTDDTELTVADISRQWLKDVATLISSAVKQTTAAEKLEKLDEARENIWRLAVVDRGSNGRAGEDEFQHYQLLMTTTSVSERPINTSAINSENDSALLSQQCRSYHAIAAKHVPFLAADGSLGLGSCQLQPDDYICILAGGEMPMIARKVQGGRYRLLGAAWIYGMMDGEAITDKTALQDIEFV